MCYNVRVDQQRLGELCEIIESERNGRASPVVFQRARISPVSGPLKRSPAAGEHGHGWSVGRNATFMHACRQLRRDLLRGELGLAAGLLEAHRESSQCNVAEQNVAAQ